MLTLWDWLEDGGGEDTDFHAFWTYSYSKTCSFLVIKQLLHVRYYFTLIFRLHSFFFVEIIYSHA